MPNAAPSFLVGDGIVTTGFGSTANVFGHDSGQSVTVQADGRILVGGTSFQTLYYYYTETSDFALARYNTDGSLDTTFGGGDGRSIRRNHHSGLQAEQTNTCAGPYVRAHDGGVRERHPECFVGVRLLKSIGGE